MIEKLMGASLRNRVLVLFVVLIVAGLGVVAIRDLPLDAFPDVTSVQVEVMVSAPGLSPPEIERAVTHPVETAMRGLPGLETLRSVTKYGLAVVTLVFEDRTDIYFARQLVFERLSSVSETLPDGVKAELGPVTTALGEVYQYTLEGPPPAPGDDRVAELTRLRTLQDWVVSPLLKGVPGVNEVNSFGGYIKEYQVLPEPEKLRKYGLAFQDVTEALRANNLNVGGGFVNRSSEQYIVRGIGLLRDEADITAVVVKTPHEGVSVRVGDVARVQAGAVPRQGLALKNGAEAVGGIVMMLKGENGLAVVRRVEEKVREINGGNVLPEGTRIRPFHTRSGVVETSVATVLRTLLEGAVLVAIVLYLLLRNLRGALVVILALPLSLLLTFILMRALGLGANLMSLGGLAISIGMIIDATIIQVENAQRRLGEETDRSRAGTSAAVLKAVLEVRRPSIFGELIIALTFVPIVTLQGMEGKMFSPLAFTVAVALLASLLLSIFVVPVLCATFLRPGAERRNVLLEGARWLYEPLLRHGTRHPWVPLGVFGALVAGALLLIPHLGTEFIPVMDEGAFDMDFQLLPGVSLEKAGSVAAEVHRRLMTFPEVDTLVSRTGQTGIALEARGVDKTGFVGSLRPRAEWTTAKDKGLLMAKMRKSLEDIPGMAFSFSQPIQCRIDELVAGTRAQVILKLFGEDLAVLRAKCAEMAVVLSKVPGASEMVVEKVAGQPYLVVRVDRAQAASRGLSRREILETVETAMAGTAATRVYEENRAIDLTVRLPEGLRGSVETLLGLPVGTGGGTSVPLSAVASVELEEGPVQISREGGQRRMGIEVNVTGRDIGGFVAEARERIDREVSLPPGYTVSWGGQFENQQQAVRRLSLVMPAVVLLVLLLLFMTFQAARPAALVFLNLPFALMGGLFALWLSGLYLSVPASVGFVVLFGVAVLNGLVLVSRVLQLREGGGNVADAVLEACRNRLRPIVMTASITVFSLVPMLFASGPGAEIQRPLAVVVVGGLVTSTLSTLWVLPAMYRWFDRKPQPG
ncbi:MAG: efflux RND transporter permease subunit [Acidobacteria bacterium]|nr:efflux RND transporter permease subunit [Acidobacteriota bacterium]